MKTRTSTFISYYQKIGFINHLKEISDKRSWDLYNSIQKFFHKIDSISFSLILIAHTFIQVHLSLPLAQGPFKITNLHPIEFMAVHFIIDCWYRQKLSKTILVSLISNSPVSVEFKPAYFNLSPPLVKKTKNS